VTTKTTKIRLRAIEVKVMSAPNNIRTARIRTARDLAEDLNPILETLANISYLVEHNQEPQRLRELVRTGSQAMEKLTDCVQKELKD
jgi:hypothetical protein